MNAESIESFITIIQQQTISAAAQTLFVSQSTISHRIQMLEQELGIVLFDRQRGFKRMELTDQGRRFYPLALQWMEVNSRMHNIRSTESVGSICIGSMDSINQHLLSHIFADIHDKCPMLQMRFVSYHSQEIYSRINSQMIDVGFSFFPIRYDIYATPVFSEPIYMISPPNSIYPKGPIHPSTLSKKNEIFFAWTEEVAQWNHEWWDEHEPPLLRVDSCGLLMTFLTKPETWALCPASVATNLKAVYDIKINEFLEPPPNRICYMLTKKPLRGTSISPAVDLFINEFNKRIDNHPWRYQHGR